MIALNGHKITPTIFPDKTSQVWKISGDSLYDNYNIITWEFENEAEFLHVAQLKDLVSKMKDSVPIHLNMPYLPYARQDKDISNNSTFALHTFASLLNSLNFASVEVVDPHNLELSKILINNLEVDTPEDDIRNLLRELKALPVYPDKGAASRYGAMSHDVVCDKIREPLTGAIIGLTVNGLVARVPYLIVDDICDGGKTFIEVAKKLYEAGATEVHLYVSHGIFSKGLQVLRDAGIKRIFTHKGEVESNVLL